MCANAFVYHDATREQIREYKQLLDEGLITEAQFIEMRDTLLRAIGLLSEQQGS